MRYVRTAEYWAVVTAHGDDVVDVGQVWADQL
jgi:hypothetical protein